MKKLCIKVNVFPLFFVILSSLPVHAMNRKAEEEINKVEEYSASHEVDLAADSGDQENAYSACRDKFYAALDKNGRVELKFSDDENAKIIPKILSEDTHVKALSLFGVESEESITALFNSLVTNKTLKLLNIPVCQYFKSDCIALSNALKKNKTLEEIFIYTLFTDAEGMQAIYDGLQSNFSLTTLSIDWNNWSAP